MRAALLLLALAGCDILDVRWGRTPYPDVDGGPPRDQLWECSCAYTCWKGDEVFSSIPHRFCASGGEAMDAGPAFPASCVRQIADSGLCGNVHALDIECACSCARIGDCS